MGKLILLSVLIQLTCFAAPPPVEQQTRQLRAILRQADAAYYNKAQSLMSDAAYDALRDQYDRLIRKYPELANTSPVGAETSESVGKVAHTHPILSLQKAYTRETIESFLEKCGTNLLYCVEPKIDGMTLVLRYRDGLLEQAITRGNGKIGTDVTAAILASGAIPTTLTNAPAWLEVRGEIFLTLAAFKALNQRRETLGQAPLKSPRNTAAGTLRLKDYAEIANRRLSVQIFELLATEPMPTTHTQALALMKSVGLPTLESNTATASQIQSSIAELNRRRSDFPFQTDGIVIKVDDCAMFNSLGSTAHHPRGALARKYKETPVETRLLSVAWTRGETGKLTPIGHFEPVEIHGATLQKASLHNLGYIRALDLKVGDWIQVIRAGGSVPEIIGICPDRRTGNETSIPEPVKN